MKNGYQHALQNQLFLDAYLYGKCVMLHVFSTDTLS